MKFSKRANRWLGNARRFLVVDFDSRQMRILQADRGVNHPRIRRLCAVDMPAGIDLDDPRAVGEFLGQSIQDKHLSRAPVVMNVSRSQSVLKPLRLPPGVERDEIAGMVQFQVQGEIPFPAEETVLDYTVEGESVSEDGSQGIDILAAAVRSSILEHYRTIADAAGLKLLHLGLRPYANVRCVEVCSALDENQTTAIVQITFDEMEIDVLEGNHLVFSRSAMMKLEPSPTPLPGDENIEESIEGITAIAETYDTTGDIVSDHHRRVDEAVAEIKRSLQGYSAVHHGGGIEAILLAGGTGLESDVARTLSQREGLNCALLEPAEALRLGKKVNEASAFLSAIGLAYGSRGAGKVPIDFLCPKKPVEKPDPVRVRRQAIALATMFAVIILGGGSWWYLDAKQATVRSLRSAKAAQEKKQEALKRQLKRVAAIEEWADQRVDWLDHWAMLSSIMPGAKECYIETISTGRDTISYTVRYSTADVLNDLVKRLTDAGYSPSVGKDNEDPRNPYTYHRRTDITLSVAPGMEVSVQELKTPARPADDDIQRPLQPQRSGNRRRRQ